MYNFNRDLIYFIKRDGTPESPYKNIEEKTHVLYEKVFLEEVPVQSLRLNAKIDGGSLVEVNRLEDLKYANNYFVNYKQGIVYFHSSQNNKEATLIYKGQGVLLYPASRIYIDTEDGVQDVVRTLKDLIVEGKTALDAVQEVNRIIKNAEEAIGEVDTAILRIDDAVSKVNLKIAEITNAESDRVSQESIRKANEDSRNAEETKRVQAEGQRNTSESNRDTAETQRQINEDSRNNAEVQRNNEEQERKDNEDDRLEKEDVRQSAENLRNIAEEGRNKEEVERNTQENLRNTAEEERNRHEEIREENEENRIAREIVREEFESARKIKEQERISSEIIRNEAEELRKSQETKRQQDTTQAVEKANNDIALAIENVNKAIASRIEDVNNIVNLKIEESDVAITNTKKATSDAITATQNAHDTIVSVDALVENTKYLEVFSSTSTYVKNNIVSYNGSSYIAKDKTVGNLPTNEIYWGLLAQRGVDGAGSVSSINGVSPDLDGNVNINIEELGAEKSINKGIPNGYAGLDGNGKVPLSQVPDTLKQQTYVVSNTTERLTLTNLMSGDKAFEKETGDSYIYDGADWDIMADADWENVSLDWTNIANKPNSNVTDIDSAVQKSHAHTNKEILDGFALVDGKLQHNNRNIGNVDSVNGKTGAVTINANDVGAYSRAETYHKDDVYTKTHVYNKSEVDNIISNYSSIEILESTPVTLDKNGLLYIKKSVINAETP